MLKNVTRKLLGAALALCLLLAPTAHGQSITTSAIGGFVRDAQGNLISGAKVTVVHVPSGTTATTITSSGGDYSVSGLRPGGPYTVTVDTPAFGSLSQSNIFLDLAAQSRADFPGDVVLMQAVTVGGEKDTTFDSSVMGLGMSLNSQEVLQVASVRRDVQDIQNLDPRVSLFQVSPSDTQYTLSFAGQNPKENLFLIDGVSATDNFGLNSNGVAGFRNPLPPEWIESLRVETSPYDVQFAGFSGGLLNTTLKSGTNTFHGSTYVIYQGTHFRGGDPVFNAVYGANAHEPIQMHTTGVTLGGPIIPNKLFFFAGYDAFREIATPPPQNYLPDATDLAAIIAAAKSYGFDPGTPVAVNHIWQRNFVTKVDWNITNDHRFEVTFRHTDGQAPNFYNYTSSFQTSLSSSWYNTHRTDQSITAKLNSDWSSLLPNLRTEVESTYKRYNGTAQLNGADFPAVTIYTPNGRSPVGGQPPYSIFIGQYWAYQNNALHTKEFESHVNAEYALGSHTLRFGVQFDRVDFDDVFIANYLGSYNFDSVAEFVAGTPTYGQRAVTNSGYTFNDDLEVGHSITVAPFISDNWQPNSKLTIMAGLRADYPYMPSHPKFSSLFYNTYGYANTATNDGNYTVQPRVGFNYIIDSARRSKTQVHGGIGLFLGSNPTVWVGNSFPNAGQVNTVVSGSTLSAPTTPVIPGYQFTGANNAPLPAAPGAVLPTFNITDKDFHTPSQWKSNVAVDRELPWGGIILTGGVDYNWVNYDAITRNINLKGGPSDQPATLPDGAIRYAGVITPGNIGSANFVSGFTTSNFYVSSTNSSTTALSANPATLQVIKLTNTRKGSTQIYSVQLHRPFIGDWSWSLAYAHLHATQVDPSPSATAGTNLLDNYSVNPNDNIPYHTLYGVPDKFVATLSKRFHFLKWKNSATTISGQFLAQTGQAFSYVFKGDANGDGISGGDLFYVPTGPNDPKVRWLSSTEQTNFFNWLAGTPDLAKWAGKIAPRNAFYAQWQRTVNLHVEQEIPIYKRARVVAYWDCFNFANLLDHSWGVVSNYSNTFQSATVAGTGYDPTANNGAGQYIYVFNPGTLTQKQTYPDMSRWAMQIGARLEF